jgi:putative MATE family efflux protein
MFSFFLPKDKKLFKYIFVLALPVIISNTSRVLMGVVDLIMIGHLGASAIAAVGIAGMVGWTFISLGIAFRTGTQSFVARRLGEKEYAKCSTALWNMLFLSLLIGVPVTFIICYYIDTIMSLFISKTNNIKAFNLSLDYAYYNFLSLFFLYASFVFQGFYTGIEKTKIHMKATLSSNIVNLYLNFGLIFGTDRIIENLDGTAFAFLSKLWTFYYFPELGVKGAAIGTMFACIWLFIHYFIYLFKSDISEKFNALRITIDKKMFKRQIEIASPVAIQETLVALSLAVFYKLIAIIGIFELAATQVVFRIMHASFMPAIGVGQACSTLVGKFLGEKNPEKAETAIYESLRGSFLMMGFMGICFICFADYIIPIFTSDINVINIAVPGLKFVGLIQFIDAICFTLWFALTGAGDTKVLALVDILSHWILFIPMVYILGITLNLGYWGAWIAFAMHLTFIAGYTTWRFKSGKWKKIVL